jgi:PAS domain S-box-containing protein
MTKDLLGFLESEIFKKSPIAFAVLDKDERILDINKAFEELFLYKKDEITNKKINNLIVPEELTKEALNYVKVLKEGKYLIEATKRMRKDGVLLDVSITAYTVKLDDKQHLIIANYFEIKDKIDLKANLEKSEKEFQAIFESSPVGIIVCEGDTHKVMDLNSTALEILETGRGQIIGKSCEDLIVSASQIYADGHIIKEECVLRLPNGTEKKIFNTSKSIIVNDKKYIVNNIMDITEVRKSEKRLHMLEHAVSQSLDGIAIADITGRIIFVNKTWLDQHGLTQSEISKLKIKNFQRDYTKIADQKRDKQIVEKDGYKPYSHIIRKRKGGAHFPASVSITQINDKNGNQIGEIEIVHDISRILDYEEKLRDREQRFNAIVESSIIGVGIANINEVFIFANQALAEMIGYEKEELIGLNLANFIGEDEYKKYKEYTVKRDKGESNIYQANLKKKSGEKVYTYIYVSPLFDSARNLEGTIAIILDITSLKKTQEQLEYERDKAQNYLDIAGVIILTLDLKGNITLINSKGCEVLGYKEEELLGKNWFETAISKEHRKGIETLFNELISVPNITEDIFVGEVLTKNGNIRTISWKNHLIHDPEGNVIGVMSSGDDITEQKEAEQALRDSEEKFRTISAFAKDAIIIMDDQGKVTYWNQSASRIFGFQKSEIMDKNLHLVLAPDRPKDFNRSEMLEFQKTGKSSVIGRTLEFTVKRKDGIYFPIELSLSAVKLKGRWNAIGIAREVGERKKAEQQVREARDKALDASKFKSQFLANMSHEIRTPMNAIIGMTDLALLTKLDTEQREYLEMVKSSADSLLALLNDILDFSKIEAGKLEVEFEPFNIREMIATALGSLAIKAHQKNIELAYNINQNVPEKLLGDSLRIRQVIINLIGNAIKFTEVGEVLLNIIPINKSDKEVTLLFSVSDTGIGIPEDKKGRIFELFAQADGSTTRKYGGTGLGLTITSQLVKLMGGEIWVDSAYEKGSTFYFNIRFKVPKGTSAPKAEQDAAILANKKVLIVDDNETNRRILKDMVKNWNMITMEAENGSQTLEILKGLKSETDWPAFILIDSNMPGMDGFTVVEKIRQMKRAKTVHIMMISSGSHLDGIKRCEELGIYGHLLKPINPAKLKSLMIEILGDKKVIERKIRVKPSPLSNAVSINVLLAEDNPVNQQLAVKMLEKMGHIVTLAGNGEEALALFNKNRFDLVLMDIQMPVMDGLIATAKIREIEKGGNKHTPIVAMTAHALKGDRERCLAAGMDGYIAKPIKYGDLEREIMRAVDKAGLIQATNEEDSTAILKSFKDTLLGKFSNDAEMLRDTILIFLQESPDQLIAMKNAILNKDKEKLQFNAHKLKGSIGVFDEGDLYYDAMMLEEIGKAGKMDEADSMILSFEDRFINLREELKIIASELK